MKELLIKNFNKVISNKEKIILIDFYGDNCPPCDKMKEVLESIESKFSKAYKFYRINVDNNESIAETFFILETPTLMFFLNNSFIPLNSSNKIAKRPSDRILGYHEEGYMTQVLTQIHGFCKQLNLIKRKIRRRTPYWQRYHDKYNR